MEGVCKQNGTCRAKVCTAPRRLFIYLEGTCNFWTPLRDPSPKPPIQCPHQTKKGTNLLLFEFRTIYLLIKT